MSSRQVKQVFEKYQKERTAFVQKVADLANQSENIETLQNVGAMALLRPLLLDVAPTFSKQQPWLSADWPITMKTLQRLL
ncbi:Sperm-associated antigen 6 [Desmophyllum pertusum]|uniref:Sperm-associated antigen 6 n=1 Tax=Desmophyllum pertusum TaxID=174260 RepID=A0A9W9YQL2_9CNID|nr:Sperm-associated antigen 6 [Desmophyllum pertusum]